MADRLKFPLVLLAVLLAVFALTYLPGRLVFTFHTGDIFHALDAAFRIADGEMPHRDFMTPLGILAFAPLALFLGAGFGPAASMVLADTLVALLLLPAVVHVAQSRMRGWQRWGFALVVLLFCVALTYGGAPSGTSFSMHYNRWAWAVSFLVLVTAVWPAERGSFRRDALVIGLGLSVLALLKMTFFLAFGAVVLAVLLLDRRFRLLGAVGGIGLAVLGLSALLLGVDFWIAYAGDLLRVAIDSPRPYPFQPLATTLAAPDRLPGTLVYLAAIVLLRSAGRPREGLILLLAAPAFAYVTYQNWGNEQKWLVFLGFYLARFTPSEGARLFGRFNARDVARVLAILAFAFVTPILVAMTKSLVAAPYFNAEGARQVPFTVAPRDLWISRDSNEVLAQRLSYADVTLPGEAPYPVQVDSFQGEPLPLCNLSAAYLLHVQKALDLIATVPAAQRAPVALADNVNEMWMLSALPRVRGVAPWYYAGANGEENADFLLVPLCPKMQLARRFSLAHLAATGWRFEEVARDDFNILYRIGRP